MTGQESGRSRLERPGLVCKLLVAALLLAFLAYVAQRGARRASDFKYVYGAARHVWTTGALNVLMGPFVSYFLNIGSPV